MPRKGTTKKMPAKAATKDPKQPQHKPAQTLELAPGQIVPDAKFFKDVERLMEYMRKAGVDQGMSDAVAAVKLLKGVELGLHCTQALRHIWITEKGDLVADSAELFRALMQRAGISLVPLEMTATRCVVECTRGSQKAQFAYTIEEAQAQGLVRPGNVYTTIPTDMLFARVTTRAARAMAADVVAGLSYTAEEVGAVQTASAGGGTRPVHGAPAATSLPMKDTPPADASPQKPRVPNAGDAMDTLPEVEGRQAVTTVTVTDAKGTRTLPSCGVTTQQLMAVTSLVSRNEAGLRPVFNGFMQALKHQKLTALTEQEAGMLIARLQGQGAPTNGTPAESAAPAQPVAPATPEHAQANTPLEAARAAFMALVQKLGLELIDATEVMSQFLEKPFSEATAEEVVQATRELDNVSVVNTEALKAAIATAQRIRESGAPTWESGGEH